MLFEIQDKIVSSELLFKNFCCDLAVCKGACCVEGSGGAPLNDDEVEEIKNNLSDILPFIDENGKKTIKDNNFYYSEWDNEKATQLIEGKNCVFVSTDEKGNISCGIENANKEKKISFNKPISCHLYPIRVQYLKSGSALNYHEWNICKAAVELGNKINLPIYKFLKEPLIRAFGEDFYLEMEKVDKEWREYCEQNNMSI